MKIEGRLFAECEGVRKRIPSRWIGHIVSAVLLVAAYAGLVVATMFGWHLPLTFISEAEWKPKGPTADPYWLAVIALSLGVATACVLLGVAFLRCFRRRELDLDIAAVLMGSLLMLLYLYIVILPDLTWCTVPIISVQSACLMLCFWYGSNRKTFGLVFGPTSSA